MNAAEMIRADLECAAAARALWPGRHFTVHPGRMTDAGYSWPIAIPAPEGWAPAGYHVTTCETCGEVTEPYSATDPRIVHRGTGWGMCAPDTRKSVHRAA